MHAPGAQRGQREQAGRRQQDKEVTQGQRGAALGAHGIGIREKADYKSKPVRRTFAHALVKLGDSAINHLWKTKCLEAATTVDSHKIFHGKDAGSARSAKTGDIIFTELIDK
jgi:hypothetical protein